MKIDTNKMIKLTPEDVESCNNCIHFEIEKNVYSNDCYDCKRYYGDLFEERK